MNNIKLFDWIYETVMGDGGDGDAVIGFMLQDYKVVAEEFREYFPASWEMVIGYNEIIFVDQQEYITLTSKDSFGTIENYGPRILTW